MASGGDIYGVSELLSTRNPFQIISYILIAVLEAYEPKYGHSPEISR